ASSGVGLMGLQIAKLKGAGLVIGSSTNAVRRARLKEFGADLTVDTSDPAWPDAVLAATHGTGVDLIIDQVSASVAKPETEGRGGQRADRQRRPLGRHEGSVRFRPARAEAHSIYRRHVPDAKPRGGARDHASPQGRSLGRGRSTAAPSAHLPRLSSG